MWQRFSDNGRRAVFYAQQEAGKLGLDCVSTEHLLLGLLHLDYQHEDSSRSGQILRHFHFSSENVRESILRNVAQGDAPIGAEKRLTPRSKRVIDLASDESRRLSDTYVGTQHLLLGLIREAEGLGGRVLIKAGLELEAVRAVVVKLTAGTNPRANIQGKENQSASQQFAHAEAIAALADAVELARRTVRQAILPLIGDLGFVRVSENRDVTELVRDNAAFHRLLAIFKAKDAYGYRAMADGEQTMILLPGRTAIKRLATPPDSEDLANDGYYVRVLDGEFNGNAGWIFTSAFERTGVDEASFPQE